MNSTMNSFDIIVFLRVRAGTSQTLLKKNCQLWTKEGAKIKLLLLKQYQVNIPECDGSNVQKFYGVHLNDTISRVVKPGSAFASASNWYLVQDAHEIIMPPPNIAHTFTSIREFVTKATLGPSEFNAISLSTVYMTNENGSHETGGRACHSRPTPQALGTDGPKTRLIDRTSGPKLIHYSTLSKCGSTPIAISQSPWIKRRINMTCSPASPSPEGESSLTP